MLLKLNNEDYWLAAGNATKDGELKYVGEKETPVCSFSIAAGKKKDTTTIFVNCQAWSSLAKYAEGVHKGDSVAVIGKLKAHEYNGKQYSQLDLEWMNYIPKAQSRSAAGVPSPSGKPYPEGATFAEENGGGGDLPF